MTDYTKLVAALRICHVVDCDDCVLKKECVESIIKGERPYVLLHNDAADVIEALQAQMPKRGEWIEDRTEIVCSKCHARFSDEIIFMNRSMENEALKYCPNCGAKMTEVQE